VHSKTIHSHIQSISGPYIHTKLDNIIYCVPQCALVYTITNSNKCTSYNDNFINRTHFTYFAYFDLSQIVISVTFLTKDIQYLCKLTWRQLYIIEMKLKHVIFFHRDTFYSVCVNRKIVILHYKVSRYLHPEDGHMSGRNMSVVTM